MNTHLTGETAPGQEEARSILIGLEVDLGYGPLTEDEKHNDLICGGCGGKAEGYISMPTMAGSRKEAVCCSFCGPYYASQFPSYGVEFIELGR